MEELKNYKALNIPKTSAWDRKTWRRYAPVWFKDFIDGLNNLVNWLPVIWKDRHWDDYYITRVLQRKIELQRDYLVKHNRHLSIPRHNRDMTIVLNLIERMQEEHYATEYLDFEEVETEFTSLEQRPGSYTLSTKTFSEKYDEYIGKYRSTTRLVRKTYDKERLKDKRALCRLVAGHNQDKCRKLLWRILQERLEEWWD